MAKIWVKEKGREYKQLYIDEADFNPAKHIKPNDEEKKKETSKNKLYWEGFKSSKRNNKRVFSIGTSKRDNNDFGVTYKGKLDSGKAEELLDYGLENAKKRATERQNKYGSMFDKPKKKRSSRRLH